MTAPKLPRPPAELTDDAVKEWRRIARLLRDTGLLTELDRGMLVAYCQAYGRWAQAERAIGEMAKRDPVTGGLLIKTSNGNAIHNPLVGIANKALFDLARFAAELGLTPNARSRAGSAAEPKLGKKEEQQRVAMTAERGSEWEGLLN